MESPLSISARKNNSGGGRATLRSPSVSGSAPDGCGVGVGSLRTLSPLRACQGSSTACLWPMGFPPPGRSLRCVGKDTGQRSCPRNTDQTRRPGLPVTIPPRLSSCRQERSRVTGPRSAATETVTGVLSDRHRFTGHVLGRTRVRCRTGRYVWVATGTSACAPPGTTRRYQTSQPE